MAKTTLVNIRKNPKEFDVYIGRAGMGFTGTFGNPYRYPYAGTREECIEKYKKYFLQKVQNDKEFRKKVFELKGKRLGCFCPPRPCHGEVIIGYLHKDDEKESSASRTM